MQLTSIEYNAIMRAIDIAKDAITEDTFIPEYDASGLDYDNASMLDALNRVENKIVSDNLPY